MPFNIKIVHAHDFIKVTPEGKLDLAESRKMLAEIARASVHLVDFDILLDTRRARSELSITDLWDLVAGLGITLRRAWHRTLKTAVLCPLERFDQAAFFALCAENRGFRVNAFTSAADAYEWLISDRT